MNMKRANSFKHGLVNTPTYRSWAAMHQRCSNPKAISFPRYGGKGIAVCRQWSDFRAFLNDMGPRPAEHTLDRINNAVGYSPKNCRWLPTKLQSRNRRVVKRYRVGDRHKTLVEWCAHHNIPESAVRLRLKRGWAFPDAVKTPLRAKSNIAALSRKHAIPAGTIYYRINRGWPLKLAIAIPPGGGHNGRAPFLNRIKQTSV